MKSITRKQIPVLLKKIAGRAVAKDGLTWTVRIGPDWDGQDTVTVSVNDKDCRTETLFRAAVVEERKVFGLLFNMEINMGLDNWLRTKTKEARHEAE